MPWRYSLDTKRARYLRQQAELGGAEVYLAQPRVTHDIYEG